MWTCSVCTLENEASTCEACGNLKPSSPDELDLNQPWLCESCTYQNQANMADCHLCHKPRFENKITQDIYFKYIKSVYALVDMSHELKTRNEDTQILSGIVGMASGLIRNYHRNAILDPEQLHELQELFKKVSKKVSIFKLINILEKAEQKDKCGICFEDIEIGSELLKCNKHSFCKECIFQSADHNNLDNGCPICKKELDIFIKPDVSEELENQMMSEDPEELEDQ